MIEREQVVVASGLARALDGIKSELRKLAGVATSNGLIEDGGKIEALSVEVMRAGHALEAKARERYVAERKGKVP